MLVRVDYNVPLDENGAITDDKRIKATVPTLDYLVKGGTSSCARIWVAPRVNATRNRVCGPARRGWRRFFASRGVRG